MAKLDQLGLRSAKELAGTKKSLMKAQLLRELKALEAPAARQQGFPLLFYDTGLDKENDVESRHIPERKSGLKIIHSFL
jgi:hypothetical protein